MPSCIKMLDVTGGLIQEQDCHVETRIASFVPGLTSFS